MQCNHVTNYCVELDPNRTRVHRSTYMQFDSCILLMHQLHAKKTILLLGNHVLFLKPLSGCVNAFLTTRSRISEDHSSLYAADYVKLVLQTAKLTIRQARESANSVNPDLVSAAFFIHLKRFSLTHILLQKTDTVKFS